MNFCTGNREYTFDKVGHDDPVAAFILGSVEGGGETEERRFRWNRRNQLRSKIVPTLQRGNDG
ncbi:MAG: hypothetical protein NTV58_10815 [Deltaproteobacteria bacterium]|nr:hypothetical protein [Deltaproteobacteria bacterium]